MGAQKRILIWKGFHHETMYDLFKLCWDKNYLLICCPPSLKDFSFTKHLPQGDISFCGKWPEGTPQIEHTRENTKYPDEPVLGIFTTGTTRAKPRLVLYSKENVTSCQESIFSLFDMSRVKQIYCYPQPYHVFGLLLGYAACHCKNLKLVIPDGKYSSDHHYLFSQKVTKDTMSLMTPTHLSDLKNYLVENMLTPAQSYTCIIGGAKVSMSQWLSAQSILNIEQPSIGYGCTEASPGISHLAPGIQPKEDGEIGRTLAHINLDFIPDSGIQFSGPSLALATIENGQIEFPKTMIIPDQLAMRKDGSMLFKSRTDNILNRGGEKFSLEAIESFIKTKHKLDTVCVPVNHTRLGSELGVIIKTPSTIKRATLYKTLEVEFGRKFSSRNYIETDQLPINDQAKLDRKAAKKLFEQKRS